MTIGDFINSKAFQKAADDATIWSWDRLNGYYQFTDYRADLGRSLILTRHCQRQFSMTKKNFLEHAGKFSSLEIEMDIWKRLMIRYSTRGHSCLVKLEDRGIVISRKMWWDIEKAEENFFKANNFSLEDCQIPEEFNNEEYA